LAAAVAHDEVLRMVVELASEHFDDAGHRAFHAALVGRGAGDVALHAELDAVAALEQLDERTGKELVFRLRERKLRRDLEVVKASGDYARLTDLQGQLERVHKTLNEI
jgi:hypothetical protein